MTDDAVRKALKALYPVPTRPDNNRLPAEALRFRANINAILDAHDTHADTPATPIDTLDYTWNERVDGYPKRGPKNNIIRYRHGNHLIIALLHYDNTGALDGFIEYTPNLGGDLVRQVEIRVRDDRQGLGIGTRLMREARARWNFDFAEQLVTPAGSRLVAKIIREEHAR